MEEDGSRQVKRRELGHHDCFPSPSSQGDSQGRAGGVPPHYYTAEFPPSSLLTATSFTVGDNHTYNGYWNTPLDPSKSYLIYLQAASNFRGVSEQIVYSRMLCLFLAHAKDANNKDAQNILLSLFFSLTKVKKWWNYDYDSIAVRLKLMTHEIRLQIRQRTDNYFLFNFYVIASRLVWVAVLRNV